LPVLFYSLVQKWVTCCPDKREIWHGEWTKGSLPRAKFHIYRGRNVGIQPQTVKISNFGDKFDPQGRLVCTIFTKFLPFVQVAFKFLVLSLSRDKQPSYKDFPTMGAFSHKFSVAPSGETTDRIKKVRGCKNGRDLLYHHGGDRGSRTGCGRKSVIFLSVSLFFVTLWNDEVCDNRNAMKQCSLLYGADSR